MIDITPDPIAIQLGPLPVYWYGICYAIGLLVAYQVMMREARRRGLDSELIINGLIIVAIAALIGGRLYHVIDQWSLYKDDPLTILLPIRRVAGGGYMFAGFSGLGVYGGILTGTIAAWLYLRWKHQSFWRWADVVAPALFAMQAIGRFGNFFNQELYGPPTNLPWGIAIQCKNRVAQYACPAGSDPNATLGQHFQPLFLYEAISARHRAALPALARTALLRSTARRRPSADLLHLVRHRPGSCSSSCAPATTGRSAGSRPPRSCRRRDRLRPDRADRAPPAARSERGEIEAEERAAAEAATPGDRRPTRLTNRRGADGDQPATAPRTTEPAGADADPGRPAGRRAGPRARRG